MQIIENLQYPDIVLIMSGIVMGTLARVFTLRADSRQNPSFPGGVFINLVTGFISSILGAVAIPAIMSRDFTAVTFLALAIQHFRDIRRLESDSLSKLENTEYTERGEAYIDGIAKTYEARNYISLITSLLTVFAMKICYTGVLAVDCAVGAAAGSVVIILLKTFTKGKTIGDICEVSEGKVEVKGSELMVDGMFVSNLLGTDISRELFQNEGLAFIITPKKEIYRVTLDNYGQRQAILFEAVRSYGVKRYKFTRKNYQTGKIVIAFVPIIRDAKGVVNTIKKTPILENSRKIRVLLKTGKGDTNKDD